MKYPAANPTIRLVANGNNMAALRTNANDNVIHVTANATRKNATNMGPPRRDKIQQKAAKIRQQIWRKRATGLEMLFAGSESMLVLHLALVQNPGTADHTPP